MSAADPTAIIIGPSGADRHVGEVGKIDDC